MKSIVEPQNLLKIIEGFPNTSILVVGDIILDSYIWGNCQRICPEAPVPVVDVDRESQMPGGAANVVSNLGVLGADVLLCGVIGSDSDGLQVQKLLKKQIARIDGVLQDPSRMTTRKTRIVAGHQQVVRFDQETRTVISSSIAKKIFKYIESIWQDIDGVIVSDYAKGVVHAELLRVLQDLNQKQPKIICVDPKEKNKEYYQHMTLITPNKKEAAMMAGKEILTEEDLKEAGRKIIHQLQCENLVITLGADGMALFKKEGDYLKIPTFAREVFDVSGAGDTVISTLTVALCSGASLVEAAILSNYAAGVVVGKIGTASVTAQELKKYICLERKRVSSKSFSFPSRTESQIFC